MSQVRVHVLEVVQAFTAVNCREPLRFGTGPHRRRLPSSDARPPRPVLSAYCLLCRFTMGRPSALPKDGDSAAPSSAKSHVKTNAGKPSAKARDKMGGGKGGGGGKGSGGGKGGGGGASPSSAPLAPPATLFPALPLSILRVSLATPSPLAAPAASTCGATALAAIAAALVDSSASLAADGDVRRTLGAAVAEWVKALGGGGADGGGGGGVVDNVGRYVAAEIAALPAADGGADTLAGVGGGAANATALGALLGGRVKEFGERRIEAACQAVGAATAEAVLRSGDEVVVWGVGAQPEVVAALERYVQLVLALRVWLEFRLPCTLRRGGGGFVFPAFPPAAVAFVSPVCCGLGSEPERLRSGSWLRTGLDWLY